METKTRGVRPAWMKELIAEYGLKKRSFSKYCTSIEAIYGLQDNHFERVRSMDSKEEKYAGIS